MRQTAAVAYIFLLLHLHENIKWVWIQIGMAQPGVTLCIALRVHANSRWHCKTGLRSQGSGAKWHIGISCAFARRCDWQLYWDTCRAGVSCMEQSIKQKSVASRSLFLPAVAKNFGSGSCWKWIGNADFFFFARISKLFKWSSSSSRAVEVERKWL